MRYRLRTLLILTSLVAVVLAARQAWLYQQWKKSIPVVVATEIYDREFTHISKQVEVRYGKQAERWLQEGMEQQAAPPEKIPVSKVISAPFDHQFLTRDNIHQRLKDPDQLVPALIAALGEPPPPDEESNHGTRRNRIKYADMLAYFGEEKICFDWAINELVNGKYHDGEELELLWSATPGDLDLEDPWDFIRPYIETKDDVIGDVWRMEAENFADKHCQKEFLDWCQQNLNNKKLPRVKRERCFLVLVAERPSLDLLKTAKALFMESPDDGSSSGLSDYGVEGLSQLGKELPSEECHALIAKYAFHRMKVENDNGYERLWEEYADPSWVRSVVEQRVSKRESGALYDLDELAELANKSLFEKASGAGPLRHEALNLLIRRFEGNPDPRLIALLEERFRLADPSSSSRDDWLRRLRHVGGFDRALQLREQWEREDPASYFKKGAVMHQNGQTLGDLLEDVAHRWSCARTHAGASSSRDPCRFLPRQSPKLHSTGRRIGNGAQNVRRERHRAGI